MSRIFDFRVGTSARWGLVVLLIAGWGSSLPADEPSRVAATAAEERLAGEDNAVSAQGRLETFRTRNGNVGYLLSNDAGQTRFYIVPAIDVNIESFVGHDVTVVGHTETRVAGKPPIFHVSQIVPPASGSGSNGTRISDMTASPSDAATIALADHEEILAPPPSTGSADVMVMDPGTAAYAAPGNIPSPFLATYPYWLRAEYLYWWSDGMHVPALVTTSPAGTPPSQAGVLGQPGTSVLFGNSDLLGDPRSGFKVSGGAWLDPQRMFGVDGSFMELLEDSVNFRAAGDPQGSPILARPFFNLNPRDPLTGAFNPPARQDSQLVSYPGIVTGVVTVDATTRFRSADLHLLANLCCRDLNAPLQCCGRTTTTGQGGVDLLVGVRLTQLSESLAIGSSMVSLDPNTPGDFDVNDSFSTKNDFMGIDFGFAWHRQRNRLRLEVLSKVALGVDREEVNIAGQTRITPVAGGPATTFTGGLLAQRTNIGSYKQDVFAVLPEVSIHLGYFVTPRLQLLAGYTFLYMSPIVRPGDQIDPELNPDLFPPENVPFAGAARPAFAFQETDFFAHGINLGVDYRF